MLLTWNDDLLTGISEIDTQHKELFNLMNWFFNACERGSCGKQIRRVFEFLNNYIAYHFDTEEAYMIKYNY